MYKVLVVDDDILTRSNLKFLLTNNDMGFEWVDEACNGSIALEMLKKKHIDIVLTDMRMPIMDGVELSREIKKCFPEIIVIAISNYNDFEYVQRSIRAGVKDYILKHNIDREMLLTTLSEQVAATGKSNREDLSYDSIEALKNRFVMKMLTGLISKEAFVDANIKYLKLPIAGYNLLPIMMRISRKNDIRKERDYYLIDFSVINICSEVFNDSCHGIIVPVHDYTYCILLHFPEIYSMSSFDFTVHSILTKIKEVLKRFMNLDVYYANGTLCKNIEELPSSYNEAQRQLHKVVNRFAEPVFPSAKDENAGEIIIKEELTDVFENALLKKDINKTLESLEQIFTQIEQNQCERLAAQILFGEIYHSIKKVCKCNNINVSPTTLKRLNELILQGDSNLLEIKNSFLEILEEIFQKLNEQQELSVSEYTKKAVFLIKKNYSKDLSLGMIAGEIGVSNSYLSTIFKSEMGCSFSEYLLNIRLRKAADLMEEGEKNIRLIAQKCGFNSYEYFFSVFKKSYGKTPKEYMLQREGQ